MTKQEPITLPHRHPTPLDIRAGLHAIGVFIGDDDWREVLRVADHYKRETDAFQLAKLREAGL